MASKAIPTTLAQGWTLPARRLRARLGLRDSPGRSALVGALGAGLGLSLVGVLAFKVGVFERLDAEAFRGFWSLQRPSLVRFEHAATNSVDPLDFALIVTGLACVAALRRRPRMIAVMALTLLGANLSTQALKAVIPAHSTLLPGSTMGSGGSFPSGHATACMSLVLCAVAIVPQRVRSLVAAVGALYALLVGYSVLVLANHYPSDVLAGFLMATLWALLAIGAFRVGEGDHRAAPAGVAQGMVTAVVWVSSLAIGAVAFALISGPPQIPTVPFACAAVLIAVVVGIGVCSAGQISARLDELPSRRHRA